MQQTPCAAEKPIFGEFASIACTASRELIMAGDRAGELKVGEAERP